MLNIGSRYQKDGFTLIKACDMMIDTANTVEINVLMTTHSCFGRQCHVGICSKLFRFISVVQVVYFDYGIKIDRQIMI